MVSMCRFFVPQESPKLSRLAQDPCSGGRQDVGSSHLEDLSRMVTSRANEAEETCKETGFLQGFNVEEFVFRLPVST